MGRFSLSIPREHPSYAVCAWVFLGLVVGYFYAIRARHAKATYYYPLPHQIPAVRDGISLRLAMSHDVLHERYPRHGEAYQRWMIRATQFVPEAIEDYCAALDALGEHEKAVRFMRLHLAARLKAGDDGAKLYTTYANLGTFLIHQASSLEKAAQPGKEQLREGIAFIKNAIDINRDAHFGRAIWHVAFAEFQLATIEKPELLLKYDIVGHRLHRDEWHGFPSMSQQTERFRVYPRAEVAEFLRGDGTDENRRRELRQAITRVGVEEEWTKEVASCLQAAAPFDQAALGIVGIWRQDGPNPHLALALGNIMERVGQRNLAWCAFRRAEVETANFTFNEKVRTRLIDFCREKQQTILVDDDVPKRFEAELKYGREYQQAYQKFEEEQIARGLSPDAAGFYNEFEQSRPPIATLPGQEDFFIVEEVPSLTLFGYVVCGAGVFAMIGSVLLRLKRTAFGS